MRMTTGSDHDGSDHNQCLTMVITMVVVIIMLMIVSDNMIPASGNSY